MTWRYEPAPPDEGYTFRWGRGSGVITVHRGDVRGTHGDETLLDTVRIGRDRADDRDLRLEARRWLKTKAAEMRKAAHEGRLGKPGPA
ncbi:hypothetical protein [Saccharopolyspora gloriosae]|uniref:hypothetical protein n=1 Tax=Saccharopolyspora gloriosae TaxID=455344 RepID=UPI001FB585C3|nr:hypothetical protein [Saccharopolyspora gloriosae]